MLEQVDPYAMPLPVALGLRVLRSGLLFYWRFKLQSVEQIEE